MINLDMINNTIEELENADTNFSNCEKLASLYIVKRFYKEQENDVVEEEFHDILPQYKKYCDIKRQYQLGETSQERVLSTLESVCTEIQEFFQTLYSSTDIPEERLIIRKLIEKLQTM